MKGDYDYEPVELRSKRVRERIDRAQHSGVEGPVDYRKYGVMKESSVMV